MVRRKKRAGLIRRSLLLSLGILFFLAMGIYVYFGIFFQSHFFYRTSIEDVDVSGMTAEEAIEELRLEVKDYLLTLYDRDGNKYQILGADMNYDYKPQGEEEKLIREQKSFLWPGEITKARKLNVDKSITYDEDLLKQTVLSLGCLQEAQMKKPENAYIQKTEDGFELILEQQGSYLIFDKLYPVIQAIVEAGETEFTFTDDFYEKPAITSDDEILAERMDKIESLYQAEITYDMGEDKEVVDQSIISGWIDVDAEYNVSLNEEKAASYIQSLASKYNTYGDLRNFLTAKGDTVAIGGGDYGWVIDKEAERMQLISEIMNGEVKTREPVYSQTAVSRNKNDIGSTYVEIDYTNQHLWYIENGVKKIETDLVSGNISKGNGSPDGIFKIVYKKSPAVLKGEDYESNVTYFMPFAYNVGIHDASWRNGKFGGSIYKTSGSHGCINVPEPVAKELYETVEINTPVVAYYREEVRLTAENTKISNAYSYYDAEKAKTMEDGERKDLQDEPLPEIGEGQRIAEDGSIETIP